MKKKYKYHSIRVSEEVHTMVKVAAAKKGISIIKLLWEMSNNLEKLKKENPKEFKKFLKSSTTPSTHKLTSETKQQEKQRSG